MRNVFTCLKKWLKLIKDQISNLNFTRNSKTLTISYLKSYLKIPTAIEKRIAGDQANSSHNDNWWKSYVIVFFNWAAYYFAYYGLQLASSNFGTTLRLNFLLLGIVEVTGIGIGTAVSKRYDKVWSMRILLLVASGACFIIADQTSIISLFLLLGRLKSGKISYNILLPTFDGLHAGSFPRTLRFPRLGILLGGWKVK